VTRRGLAVLPVVAAAAIMAGLGIAGGLVLLVMPGIVFWLRWQVAAQAAAIEQEGWEPALRRSWSLTEANVLRVLLFLVCVTAIPIVPWVAIRHAFGDGDTALSFLAATALQTVTVSFTALATALLYFDLRRRRQLLAAESSANGPA
jgi:hypothetical protein